ncbi:hypothetical protein B4U80_14095 [Leptotrombidium deliense]|uniref:DM domain-containing protein n=1 Tax=Leptotrombidium deliense TaxID=299467 RepID=A0A443S2S0_9ACAR|nr:hypothetical protein B4U80_14095 [Leptotrombidium deliense]
MEGTVKKSSCLKCRGHGSDVSTKGHRDVCPYRNCLCANCSAIDNRTDWMRREEANRKKN